LTTTSSFLSRFVLGDELGAGGMGRVLRATDKDTGDIVALKIVQNPGDDGDGTNDVARRFSREVSTAARLDHENICRVVAFAHEQQQLFMAMELVDGPSLQRLHKQRLPLPLAVEVVRQLCLGLDNAHRHGVIHRDIKPANVMVTTSGVVKLVDFGIARSVGDETLTQTGALLGTPAYMSPEQVTGGVVDGRTDLYAAGATLFTLAAGRMRFSGMEPTSILLRVSREPTPTLFEAAPHASPVLARLVAKATSLSPRERFATGGDMAAALERTDEWQVFGSVAAARQALARFLVDGDALRLELGEALRARHLARAEAARARGATDAAILAQRSAGLCTNDDTVLREPPPTPQLTEVLTALEATPTAPGLLKRAADLYRATGVPRLAAAYLLRYLQERPGDSVAATQLAILVDGTADGGHFTQQHQHQNQNQQQQRLATRDIVAGINTGGAAAAAVVQTRHRERGQTSSAATTTTNTGGPAPVVVMTSSANEARMPPLVWGLLGLGIATMAIVGFVRFVRTSVDTVQMTVSDNTEQIGRMETNNAERRRAQQLTKAQGLLERGQHQAVINTINELMAEQPPNAIVLDAVLLRAASREALNDGVSARLDLELFLRESPVNDPRRPAAKERLDRLYAAVALPPGIGTATIPTAGGLR
jgi:serine/threonine-protein kinase